jgi:hypothetical protein
MRTDEDAEIEGAASVVVQIAVRTMISLKIVP